MENLNDKISEIANRIYSFLGAGHEEAVYRDTISVEMQDKGWIIKTEMPINIKYTISKGREIVIGSGRVDIFAERMDESGKTTKAIIELKVVAPLNKKKNNKNVKEYLQLKNICC